MKVLLAAHGYPPELVGGTESCVQALAHGLAARGVAVVVVAGSLQCESGYRTSEAVDRDPASGAAVRVIRIHRADLYFDHWQKSASARVAETFAGILAAERPDLVHVHHWIRLSHDLVATAAGAGIPAVVTLHDLWTTCLLSFRLRSDTQEACEELPAASICLECAGRLPPRTPWQSPGALAALFAARRDGVRRELALARAVLVPSRGHAAAI
ncbi:MAG: glycosyltransferase, partial [Planctomycetota bacterium]